MIKNAQTSREKTLHSLSTTPSINGRIFQYTRNFINGMCISMRTLTVYFSTSSIDNTGYFNVLVSKRREEINRKKGGAGVVPYSDSRQKMHALGPRSALMTLNRLC